MPRKPERPKAYTNHSGWYVRYTWQGKRRDHPLLDDDGNRVTTQRGAAVAVDTMWALMQRGTDPRPEGSTVAGLVADYLKALKNAPRTIEEKRRMLGLFSAWAAERKISSARDVSATDAAAYLDGLPGGPRWRNLTRTYLAHCWSWAKLPNVWEETQAAQVERRPKPTVAPATWERILAKAYPQHRLLFEMAHYTGMRPGELCALKWTDLHLEHAYCDVHTLKGHKSRAVPLSEVITTELTLFGAWLAVFDAMAGGSTLLGPVFVGRLGTPWDPITYNHALGRTCKRAGVPHFGPHRLRHTAATEMLQAGAPLPAVRDAMGHHSISVTNVYAHAAPEAVREAMEKRGKKR